MTNAERHKHFHILLLKNQTEKKWLLIFKVYRTYGLIHRFIPQMGLIMAMEILVFAEWHYFYFLISKFLKNI